MHAKAKYILNAAITAVFCLLIGPAPTLAQDRLYDPPRDLPAFDIYTLNDRRFIRSKLQGRWTLMTFWTTWCPYCLNEIPRLVALERQFERSDFEVMFISLDFAGSGRALLEKIERARLPDGFTSHYTDNPAVWNSMAINGVPSSYLVGPDGKLHRSFSGTREWTGQESLAFFNDLLDN